MQHSGFETGLRMRIAISCDPMLLLVAQTHPAGKSRLIFYFCPQNSSTVEDEFVFTSEERARRHSKC